MTAPSADRPGHDSGRDQPSQASVLQPADVLEFWFGPPPGAPAARAEWFRKDDAFDALIRTRFGPLIESALAGELDNWAALSAGSLARILVLDQFTRNVHRDTPRAFAGDPLALAGARALVANGWHLGLPVLQRWFCYLPFEHSEALADQNESLRLFGLLREDPLTASAYDYAVRHREVIVRFGRFPHRNEILGRASSAEEIAFLQQPGSRF